MLMVRSPFIVKLMDYRCRRPHAAGLHAAARGMRVAARDRRTIWVFTRQGETGCPRITGGISPARRADKKEETCGFLLLANHPLSLRRATGAVGRSPAKRMPPTCYCDRQGLAATPEGVEISLLSVIRKWAAILWCNAPLRASARPYLRQQMSQIFGQTLLYLLSLKKEKG